MEGHDGLRTVDCLRGRLLAERQASRVAKQDAEQMGNKLVELENRLREEIELRKKSEKKLKFLMKKLRSLKILEESSSSAFSSASSSSTISSISIEPEPNSHIINSNFQHDLPDQTHQSSSIEHSLSSADSHLKDPPPIDKSTEDAKSITTDNSSSCSLRDPIMEKETNNGTSIGDDTHYIDDSLALVPVNLADTKRATCDVNIGKININEVLDALKHAREKIQTSMMEGKGRRRRRRR